MKLNDLRGAVRPIVTLALIVAAIIGFLAVVIALVAGFLLGRVSAQDLSQLVKDFWQLVMVVAMFWFAQRQQEKNDDADKLTTSRSITETTVTKQGEPS